MDIKVGGLTVEILTEALEQAHRGRMHILDCMEEGISAPRNDVSKYAPRLKRLSIPVEKIGLLIGPGGRQIKAIQETTGSNIEVDDDGVVLVSAPDAESVEAAFAMVRAVTAEVEVGQVFDGKVVSIKDFGAFVEIAPGQEGALPRVGALRRVRRRRQLGGVARRHPQGQGDLRRPDRAHQAVPQGGAARRRRGRRRAGRGAAARTSAWPRARGRRPSPWSGSFAGRRRSPALAWPFARRRGPPAFARPLAGRR